MLKSLIRVSAGLKFTLDILSKQSKYCSDIWNFLGQSYRHSFYHHRRKLLSALLIMKTGVVLLPVRTVGAAYVDWLAFYLMRRLELVDEWKWIGYRFLLLFSVAALLVSHGKWMFR